MCVVCCARQSPICHSVKCVALQLEAQVFFEGDQTFNDEQMTCEMKNRLSETNSQTHNVLNCSRKSKAWICPSGGNPTVVAAPQQYSQCHDCALQFIVVGVLTNFNSVLFNRKKNILSWRLNFNVELKWTHCTHFVCTKPTWRNVPVASVQCSGVLCGQDHLKIRFFIESRVIIDVWLCAIYN